jgi:hypothetical protein
MDQLLVAPNTFAPYLTRLELQGRDTLLDLAPYLQQLPALQHLGACITLKVGKRKGRFARASGRRVSALPDMDQLCPRLVSLHLTLNTLGVLGPTIVLVPSGLSRLLPLGLEQLHLAATGLMVDATHLTHLAALRHLTLAMTKVVHALELMDMTRLQQLELWHLYGQDLVPLASKLVGVWESTDEISPATLSQLTGLTALHMRAPITEQPPEVNPLLSLTSLRHLYIEELEVANSWLLEGLSSLASLRSLELVGGYPPQVLDLVGQVTQLTSLNILLFVDGSCFDAKSSWVLQQLTGLQHLQVDQAWLEACSRVWGSLQQLTQLVVWQHEHMGDPLLTPEQLLAPLQGRGASLQHVVYLCWLPDGDGVSCEQPAQEVVPCPLPGVRLTLMCGSMPLSYAVVRPRPVRRCPHLPGVWEVISR